MATQGALRGRVCPRRGRALPGTAPDVDEDVAEEALDAERYADLGGGAGSDDEADGAPEGATRNSAAAGACPCCPRCPL